MNDKMASKTQYLKNNNSLLLPNSGRITPILRIFPNEQNC